MTSLASIQQLQANSESKRTVVVKPIPKHLYSSVVLSFLEQAGQITEFKRIKKKLYAHYSTPTTAALAIQTLHGTTLPGTSIPVSVQLYQHQYAEWRHEKKETKREPERQTKKKSAPMTPATTTTPPRTTFTGRYLLQLLKIVASSIKAPNLHPLVKILTMKRKNHVKETCESFAATRALFDFDQRHRLNLRNGQKNIVAFVPGDGCRPYTASTLMLQVPNTWTIFSIDPALATNKASALTGAHPRLHCIGKTLESISLDDPPFSHALQHADVIVVLAVHSHAPLQAFWSSQLPSNVHKIAVSIPCCGDYGWLKTNDLQYQYIDGEIDSPGANTVLVYENIGRDK